MVLLGSDSVSESESESESSWSAWNKAVRLICLRSLLTPGMISEYSGLRDMGQNEKKRSHSEIMEYSSCGSVSALS